MRSAILVTSGGFIGTWIAEYALRAGYNVRLAVRSAEKGEAYRALFARYPARTFKYIVVPDGQRENAYDEAVKDVGAVVHTASPVSGQPGQSVQECFINPAVRGTTHLLRSVAQNGRSVQRVVVTSSVVALGPLHAPADRVVSEQDWNETTLAEYRADPASPNRMNGYFASKILAERAAWAWYANRPPGSTADLVTILPSWVFGPFIHPVRSPAQVPSGVAFHRMLFAGKVGEDAYLVPRHGCVDVRDVAEMHLRALEVPEAGGQRFAAQARTWVWQDVADAVHASPHLSPDLKRRVPPGRPGSGKEVKQAQVDASEAKRLLGTTYRSNEATVDGELLALADAHARGWTGLPGDEVLANL